MWVTEAMLFTSTSVSFYAFAILQCIHAIHFIHSCLPRGSNPRPCRCWHHALPAERQQPCNTACKRHHLSVWGARISWHTPPAALSAVDLAQREGCWFSATAPTPATRSSVYLYPPPTRSGTSDLPHAPFPSASNTQAIFSRDRVWQGCPRRDRWGRIPQLHIPIARWRGWWGTEAIQSTTVPS